MLKRIYPELLEHADTFCFGAFFGVLACFVFDKSAGMFLGFYVLGTLFSILKLRPSMESIPRRVAEKMDALRYRGVLPPESEAIGDFHVKRLKDAGEDELAVSLHQALHRVTQKDAERAVDAL